MADSNSGLDFFGGQSSTLYRWAVMGLLLGLGGLNANTAFFNPPDTSDRIYKSEFLQWVAEVYDRDQARVAKEITAINHKSIERDQEDRAALALHLEHSAEWTAIIRTERSEQDDMKEIVRQVERDLIKHLREDH